MDVKILPIVAVNFVLMFGRLGALVMLMPGFGETGIPTRVRLALGLLVVLVLYPFATQYIPADLIRQPTLLGLIFLGEIAIGLFVGLVARLTLSAVQVAGAIVAAQTGLSFAMTVDPTQGEQGAVVGNFLSLVSVALIFAFDIHHMSVEALASSYKLFAPGRWMEVGDFAQAATMLVAESFKIGVQVSAPFIVFGTIFNIGLGILNKLMPQFQVYFVAMPASIAAGFLLLAAVVGPMMLYYTEHVQTGLGRLIAP